MNKKILAVWAAVVIVIALGGWLVYKNVSPKPSATEQTQDNTKVQAQDVKVGTGAEATWNTVVSVLYVGKLTDGTIFDSSEAQGNKPLTFQLGAPGLIPGFQIGVNGMKEGGERIMAIPAALAYGSQDVHADPKDPTSKVIIPANSTILFDVKLVKVQSASSTAATSTPAGAKKSQ